jgi:polyferredoxin
VEEAKGMQEKIKQKLLKYNTPRRAVQFFSFLFFSAIVFNLGSLALVVPVLWTWGLNQNTVADAFTAIQFTFYIPLFPWIGLASFLIVGILIGKSLCGWVCPFGFTQDLVGFIKRRQTEFSLRTHESMIYVKYFVLSAALFVSITFSAAKVMGVSSGYESVLGVFARAPFTSVSPAETLFATLPRIVLNFRNEVFQKPILSILSGISTLAPLFWVQLIIMVGVVVFAAYVPRSWCKYFCPHGAIMAVLNRFSFIGLRRDLTKCVKGECRSCVEVCPMRVKILDSPWEKFSDPECIYCMKCVDACPDKAIKLKYP